MRPLLAIMCALTPALASAATAPVLAHSGYLLDASDHAVTGTLPLAFAIHEDLAGGDPIWTSASCPVAVTSGHYAVLLGDACGPALTEDAIAFDGERYLEVSIENVKLAPRLRLRPVPVSARAAVAARATVADDAAKLGGHDPAYFLDAAHHTGVIAADRLPIATETTPGLLAPDRLAQLEQLKTLGAVPACATPSYKLVYDGETWGCVQEDDPRIGVLTAGKWCRAQGTGIVCDRDPPTITEADPKVGALNDGRLCRASGGQVVCDSALAVDAQGSLVMDGPLKVGAATTCDSGRTGTIRWNASAQRLEVCAASGWLELLAVDDDPDPVTFTPATGASPGATVTSNTVTVTGLVGSALASANGDGAPLVSVNGGAFVASASLQAGQTLAVRQTAASSRSTTRVATVRIGRGQATFSVTTSAEPVTRTFEYTGANESFTVPAGVTQLTVKAKGAGGGAGANGGSGGAGGAGGYAQKVLPVLPGTTYTVVVGQGGRATPYPGTSSPASFGGGGSSTCSFAGGAGGGATALLLNGTALVAAGGGGGGNAGGGSGEYGRGGGAGPLGSAQGTGANGGCGGWTSGGMGGGGGGYPGGAAGTGDGHQGQNGCCGGGGGGSIGDVVTNGGGSPGASAGSNSNSGAGNGTHGQLVIEY